MENPRLPQRNKDSECSQGGLYFLEIFSILERYIAFFILTMYQYCEWQKGKRNI